MYISQSDFKALNALRIEQNETVFSTARNAAAGSLRHSGKFLSRDRFVKLVSMILKGNARVIAIGDNNEKNCSE